MKDIINERKFRVRDLSSLRIVAFGREKKGKNVIAYYAICTINFWSPDEPFVWRINTESATSLLSELNVTTESVWEKNEFDCFYHDVEWLANMPNGIMTPQGYFACIPFFSDLRFAQHRTAKNHYGKPLKELYLNVFLPAYEFREGASLEEIKYKLETLVDDELATWHWIPKEPLHRTE